LISLADSARAVIVAVSETSRPGNAGLNCPAKIKREEIMLRLALVAALVIFPGLACADDDDIVGTYRLISAQRVILETGKTEDAYGKNPSGFITYGRDGRMMTIVVFSNRPRPESLDKMTDQQRADLFRTMTAYGGTYTFHGDRVEHHIDISWNEVWTGTTVIRDIKKEGDRLVYTTKPAPFPRDGKMSVNTLVWEKVK
jgi:hypothetical protein